MGIVSSSIYAYHLSLFNLEGEFILRLFYYYCVITLWNNAYANNHETFDFFFHSRSIDEIPIPRVHHLCTKILSVGAAVLARLVHRSRTKL